MTAQQDPEMFRWLKNAQERGGSFITAIATAGLCAESENYHLIHGILLIMRAKYPQYNQALHGAFVIETCYGCYHVHLSKERCGTDLGGGGICECKREVAA